METYLHVYSSQVRDIAFLLRKEIKEVKKKPLPANLKLDNIFEGEVTTPDVLRDFLSALIIDPRYGSTTNENKDRRIETIAHNIIFAATNGRVMPSTHIELGLALKSITGNKNLITMMNRMGHSINYHTAEELETELTFTATKDQKVLPDDLHSKSYLRTGVAFDNYDRFVETVDGKDTLHDTVGIVYQDWYDENHPSATLIRREAVEVEDANEHLTVNRRRTFEVQETIIPPYPKKPRMDIGIMLATNDPKRQEIPQDLDRIRRLDFLWNFCLAMGIPNTPMWVGWNSRIVKDTLPQQKICYLPQLNASPTSSAVVAETMRIAKRLADECNQTSISVTYDLAIAKQAFAIQAQEKPEFDNLFIQLGSFHIELSFFKAVGKFIAESGGPFILTETGILASGSLRGFITGKHYNRCKRIHPLFSAALETLHFKKFYSTLTEEKRSEIEYETTMVNMSEMWSLESSTVLASLCQDYQSYCEDTAQGKHGTTAKYWMLYIRMIRLYHTFSRAVRTGNHLLYIFILPQFMSLFFVFNHQNYARWLVHFHNNLLRMEDTHPGITEEFKRGLLSIRRTDKPFSRGPIDLTLEQTMNGDAANGSSGREP